MKVRSILEVFPKPRRNSDRVCKFTHVVSGSEAIHYAGDHVRIVPIEVGNERVYVQCGHAVQTAVLVHVLGRIVK